MNNYRDLVLASESSRRREILSLLGLPFRVLPSALDETALMAAFPSPDDAATGLAAAKALEVAKTTAGAAVIGADTLVVLGDRALGKPRDANEARQMLQRLRGKEHRVITGVAVASGTSLVADMVSTRVWMRDFSDEEMERYIASGDPLDKAGAYAIQSEAFRPVARIEGCYLNVVGLPLCITASLLNRAGYGISLAPFGSSPQECRYCAE
ncbi:MAG: septum formation protein Maf [Chloroflexi bacterium]|nr:septum formation protein Maf [Chloroflexota bacterium]